MEEIVKELGGSVQTGAVSVIALAMAYGVYAGYFLTVCVVRRMT